MLLGGEGVAVCCICIVWMIILLQRVAVQRYSMFSIFMVRVRQATHALRVCVLSNKLAG
jgi:uncharacterized membrane protein